MTRQFDWEIELAAVIGRKLKAANEAQARDAIAGYSIGIDFTCRDLLNRNSPAGVDLVRAKAQDSVAPLGPVMIPAPPDRESACARIAAAGQRRPAPEQQYIQHAVLQ
jgi:2-keto-4-pentenoate hydratase/2-oxohepta-3-ene-1,7-dioic acid hydratase in catechol pathway